MIQEIKIKNFLSFKDEVKFSFEASNDKFAEDSQVVKINENTRLLRFAVVYGYNASGKSNLLSVFDYLHQFWTYKPDNMDEDTGVIPFRLNSYSPNDPTSFEIIFYAQDIKYWYQLILDEDKVHLEKLSFYKSTQPILLFERILENGQSTIHFNTTNPNVDKISSVAKEEISIRCLKNLSFFVARNQVNVNLPLIDSAKDWLRTNIMQVITPATSLTNYAQQKTSEDNQLVNHILGFLKEADFNVTNISTDVVSKDISEDTIKLLLEDDDISKSEKERIKKERTIKQLRTFFQHSVENENGAEAYQFLGRDESRGTIRVFGLEAALYVALKKNGFLPIDEIETSLHPKLLEKVLYEYLKIPTKSQILIATHDDGLLDLVDDLIRKDSVWFTEKNKAGITDLYKLTDFRGINRLSSIREAYRNKRFGATMK
ncbi:MAG: ATP-binding protein [Prevotella sp.]|nr:ATP-binding protein [Prevotella sp.]